MKKLLLIFLLATASAVSLQAQAEITRSVFIPPEYYIGDPVELRLQLELERFEVLTVPLNIDEPEWVEIRDVRVVQEDRSAEIIIEFTSFSPGTRALPDMDFGPFSLDDFKIYTKSLVEEGQNELKGLRPQIMIPGSRLYFFLVALGIFILPYLLYFTLKLSIRYAGRLIRKYHSARPYRALVKTLKKLDAGLDKIEIRDFFITLTDSLRVYLSVRTGFDCRSATTREISRLHGFGLDQTLWDRLVSVLRQGDLVKFGGETMTREEMRENLEFIAAVCQDIEKQEDFHVDL